MKKIISFILGHKIIVLIMLAVIGTAGYFGYQKINPKKTEASYITATVEKGMLISSIPGTGQVSASNQVEIKPKVSGDIVLVNVNVGQAIKQSDLIAQIDTRDAVQAINEAQINLENAKLDLEELLAPTDKLTLLQAENAVIDAQDSLSKLKTSQANEYQQTEAEKQKAKDNLEKAYEDAYNTIANAFLDLPTLITGLYNTLYSYEIANSEISINNNSSNIGVLKNTISTYRDELEKLIDSTEKNYETAKTAYDINFNTYKNASRYSERFAIEELVEETLETTKKISDTIKNEINIFDYWVDYRSRNDLTIFSKATQYQSTLNSYTSQTNSHLSGLLSAQRSIEDYKESVLDAERSLEEMDQYNLIELAQPKRSLVENQQKLNDLKVGATDLEIKSQQLIVQQRQNSLVNAQQNYADCFMRAPFNGTIVEISITKGDSASSGTTIATLITDQKIAEITLNEIDAAQVKIGQKVTLTFDAVEDLSITGEVAEIDTLGTVSQGVVSYGVKIAFDVQDERIKPGMSMSASIILESKQNVLLAPISAVKTSSNNSYVEILVNNQPQRQTVTTGSSNDTMIEIIEGLEEGDSIITQTVSNGGSGQSSTSQNQNSSGGMQMMRMIR